MRAKFTKCMTFLFTTICFFNAQPAAALTLEHKDLSHGYAIHNIGSYEPIGQSFYATDGDIGTIGFFVADWVQQNTSGLLNLSVYSGAGMGGALLGEVSINYADFSLTGGTTQAGYLDFDVSAIDFTSDNFYSAVMTTDSYKFGMYNLQHSYTNGQLIDSNLNYLGGDLIREGNIVTYSDAMFHILPEPVPEPSTILLLGLGLLSFLWYARRRKQE